MLNPLDVYESAGRLTGQARNVNDESCAQFHTDWFRRAAALETPENRLAARKAFNDAYYVARHNGHKA